MLKAPFPWFGGKSRVAHIVWKRFGDTPNYIEPFFGSGSVLLSRPNEPGIETINDKDGFVCNFWRSVVADPEATAKWADWPVNESDLHARHVWLKNRRESLSTRLEGDPDYYDAKIAGWWCWGLSVWIGGGFCGDSGAGPWQVVDGQLVNTGGRGVSRQRVHLGNAGQGVSRKRILITNDSVGVSEKEGILEWFTELSERMRRVRVCCGDWSRICGPTPTIKQGLTGVFLDPPYGTEAGRDNNLYTEESTSVANEVKEWALDNGDNPLMRIALCGYEGEHDLPGWDCVIWKASGGYGNQSGNEINSKRERIWFSPHCIKDTAGPLFERLS
jgi:DNA adenine methylase